MKNLLISILLILISNFITMGQVLNETLTDVDGNVYKTVKIGDQIWMTEFLRSTKYADGSEIPLVTENKGWSKLKSGAYCNFYNKENPLEKPLEKNIKKHGRLYNWFAVNDKKGLCPKGWRIPTYDDWDLLMHKTGRDPLIQSYKGWWSHEYSGSDYLPPDYRNKKGEFPNKENQIQMNYGGWWVSSDNDDNFAQYVSVGFSSYNKIFYTSDKNAGFCVLCIKDN